MLTESSVGDLAEIRWRHRGRHVTFLGDQDHAHPGTQGVVVDLEAAIEHGLPLDPDYPHVWLVSIRLEASAS